MNAARQTVNTDPGRLYFGWYLLVDDDVGHGGGWGSTLPVLHVLLPVVVVRLRADAVAVARRVRMDGAHLRVQARPVRGVGGGCVRGWAVHLEGGVADRGNAQPGQMQGLERGVRLKDVGVRRVSGRRARMGPVQRR